MLRYAKGFHTAADEGVKTFEKTQAAKCWKE
jgi:hypothetical protein